MSKREGAPGGREGKEQVSLWVNAEEIRRWRKHGKPLHLSPIFERSLKDAMDRLGYD